MLTDKEFLSFINDKSLDGSLEENLNKIIDEEMEKSEEEMDTELIEYCLDKLSNLEVETPNTEGKKGNGDSNGKHIKFKFKKFIYALAPMAGVTDFSFREICSNLGADLVVSEMISAKALEYNNARTQKMLKETSSCLKAVQLFGHDANAVGKVVASGILNQFDIIDFNCGCPAKKIVGNNDGSAMMRNLNNTRKVLQAVRDNTSKPISVKFRLGIDGYTKHKDQEKK